MRMRTRSQGHSRHGGADWKIETSWVARGFYYYFFFICFAASVGPVWVLEWMNVYDVLWV